MQISVLNNYFKKIAFINNNIEKMLHYTNDSWHDNLENWTTTFDFTIPKWYDGELHDDSLLIDDSCYFLANKKGRYELFTIFDYTANDYEITVQCNSASTELAKEDAKAFSSTTPQPLVWYAQQMGLLNFTFVTIGTNELSNKTMKLTYDSEEPKLDRLKRLVADFGGEGDLKTIVNSNGSFETYRLDIYLKNDGTHQGVGRVRNDITLYFNRDIKGVSFNSNKDEQHTSFYCTGKTSDGKIVNISDLELSLKNDNGIEEFFTQKGSPVIYAPIAARKYTSAIKVGYGDIWNQKTEKEVEVANKNELLDYMVNYIKQHAYPNITYTVDANSTILNSDFGLAKGDTVTIHDNNFLNGLVLKARVADIITSDSNPSNGQVQFSNYNRITTSPTSQIYSQLVTELNNQQPYSIQILTSNGTVFKNNAGSTIATAKLTKGTSIYDASFSWYLNGDVVSENNLITINGSSVSGISVYTVTASINGVVVATNQVTLTNINDGITLVNTDRYYLLTNDNSGITTSSSGWTTNQLTLTSEYKYLWVYEQYYYSNNTYGVSDPIIIAQN
ncbi:hypothetical protein [Streptococcus parauberis]|uniref:hypothetical protein n=1 Tax=Streptococcus parauberis TaxID=1348 RepID=UPI000789AF51|nr:hypothetical protein [Streptococcus parauberis]QBX18148.1 tail assembly protein [Streptococcus phage Javan399]KYP20776.1 hypothetical protein AKL13_00393 [Streptococcus parauberis]KYP21160.1 hypothetical protein TN39_00316 [Streptococcus parauberis]KYP22444.1 hypothetical protein AKL14_00446 [Streptococcus parauberis]KYP24819.1 hypothetical protein ADO04_01100 [Streptococcus parauberis]